MYKLITVALNPETPSCILNKEAGIYIPFDPSNIDYQAYLKWLEEGNTPEPADQPE